MTVEELAFSLGITCDDIMSYYLNRYGNIIYSKRQINFEAAQEIAQNFEKTLIYESADEIISKEDFDLFETKHSRQETKMPYDKTMLKEIYVKKAVFTAMKSMFSLIGNMAFKEIDLKGATKESYLLAAGIVNFSIDLMKRNVCHNIINDGNGNFSIAHNNQKYAGDNPISIL